MRRASVLLRGPGVLVLLILAALAATAISRHNAHAIHTSRSYFLSLSRAQPATGPTDGIRVSLQSGRARDLPGTQRIAVDLRIALRNTGHSPHTVRESDFFAVDRSGQSFGPASRGSTRTALAPSRSHLQAVTISLPARTRWIEVEWNDGGTLIPPARLAVLQIHTASVGSQ